MAEKISFISFFGGFLAAVIVYFVMHMVWSPPVAYRFPERPSRQLFRLMLVADIDHASNHNDTHFKSAVAEVQMTCDSGQFYTLKLVGQRDVHVERTTEPDTRRAGDGAETPLRGAEFSEAVRLHNGRVLLFDDYRGGIYTADDRLERVELMGSLQLDLQGEEDAETLAEADAESRVAADPRLLPFKSEWATVKDGRVLVGSLGAEYVVDGRVLHRLLERVVWLNAVDGTTEVVDWGARFHRLRAYLGAEPPGYVLHEAVEWIESRRQWLIAPRRVSETTPYDPVQDENMGTNLVILANEDFSQFVHAKVGELVPQEGWSAVRLIPGTEHVVLVRTYEVGAEHHSWICVLSVDGQILSLPAFFKLPDGIKFEGLYIVETIE